jgi:probable HAF family extracellular repeat protein
MRRSLFFRILAPGIETVVLACLTLSVFAQANSPSLASANVSVMPSGGQGQDSATTCREPQFCRPESILGHTLVFERRTHDASTQISSPTFSTQEKSASTTKCCFRSLRYFVTDLGTLGGTESFAYAINDWAQIVGFSETTGDTSGHSFLYRNGQMTDLYPLNSQNIVTVGPTDINDFGQIASGLMVNGIYVPAVLNSASGQITLLGSLGGATSFGFSGVATSLNNVGEFVGYSYVNNITQHAFLYHGGTITDLDPSSGSSTASGINDESTVAGYSAASGSPSQAVIYSNGTITHINPLGSESYARHVNNRGQVVGEFLTADGTAFHAFLYADGAFADLGAENSPESVALAINDHYRIVGTTWIPYKTTCSGQPCIAYKPHAFVYKDGNITDLNDLTPTNSDWELSWAFDINNEGLIVGYGLRNGKFLAFLLTPAINREQCKDGHWNQFGFSSQGRCIRFVNTGK